MANSRESYEGERRSAPRLRLGTIRARLMMSFVAVALLPVTVIAAVSSYTSFRVGYEQVESHLESVTSLKALAIEDWAERLRMSLSDVGNRSAAPAEELLGRRASAERESALREGERARFEQEVIGRRRFDEIFLMDTRGQVVLSTRPAADGAYRGLQPYFKGGLATAGIYVQTASFSSGEEGVNTIVAVQPVKNASGRTLGVLAGRASLATLDRVMAQRQGLGESGETYLVGANSVLLTASRFPGYTPGKNYLRSQGIDAAVQAQSDGSGLYDDYRGVPVLGVYRWLPSLKVGLLVEEDRADVLRPLLTTLAINAAVALAALLIAIAVSAAVARSIARPVSTLARTAAEIAGGNLELIAPVGGDDEISTLAGAFNTMTSRLRGLIAGLEERVDELDRASKALRESEAEYRRIVDTAGEGIWVLDSEGVVTFVNAKLAEMLGRSPEDLVGHPATDYMFEEDWPSHLKVLEERRRGRGGSYDRRLRSADGRTVWTSISANPILSDEGRYAGSIALLTDITERKRAEDALRVSQRKLALHLEQTLVGVIEWDTDFRAREWNPAAEAMFGYTREEALGRHAFELIVSESVRADVDVTWRSLLEQSGGGFSTNENVTKDGRTILCEWVNTPLLDEDGNVTGVMSLARDITERRQAEHLRVEKEAAEAATLAKSTFLANMSHEIRTPMNAILGFAQLLRKGRGLSEEQRRQLDIIASSGEHLLALINDVLEMSKIEAGRVTLNPSAFDLRAMLNELQALFGQRAEAKGLGWLVVCDERTPRLVTADENKLRQVLLNLLGNAVKFTDEGSIELRVDARQEVGGGLTLLAEIRDTGRGIAADQLDRLFRPFEQVAVPVEGQAGSGLGLAISREFVRLMGGEITVESEVGVGSVFRFEIPVERATSEQVPRVAEERRVVGLVPRDAGRRILIADDAPDNRELLEQILGPIGFETMSVPDGKRAIEAFEQWHPNMVLMDMRMPVIDGYEATRRIRSMPGGKEVAIIGVTASAFAEMKQGVFDAGVDEFVSKPFHENEVLGKIGTLLGVEYVFENRAEPQEQDAAEVFTHEAVSAVPADLVSRIGQAAVAADFGAVAELADELERRDPRMAAALRALAESFDAERILAAVGPER